MSNVINIADYQRKKKVNKVLKESQLALKITKKYYKDLQPYFKYQLVYTMGKDLLEFRKDLVKVIKEMKRELERINERQV